MPALRPQGALAFWEPCLYRAVAFLPSANFAPAIVTGRQPKPARERGTGSPNKERVAATGSRRITPNYLHDALTGVFQSICNLFPEFGEV